ncbi:dTTP/UTP pyrophosphatase [Geodia barretti]|uniref:dTTP/UTP pyrophosphatase n=1 Tax=Geodia barretti TaxID=519541 RepID=A0AA35R9M2_GEOBA|nr:dTTP/UTP pyrophosphatase [Geodia barretti]
MRTRKSPLKISRLILASASPRRAALLSQIGLTFEVRPSDIVEPPLNMHTASQVTQKLALLKATDIAQHFDEAIIIGADTLVSLEGKLLGKPTDDADAFEMLTHLSGTCHEIVTGVALVDAGTGRETVWAETTQVYFRELHSTEIDAYILSGEASDMAGAYGIQGRGAAFVRRIEGCYFSAVGLPLASLVEHLSNFQFFNC